VRTPASTRRWYETLRCATCFTPRRRQDAKGTLREHTSAGTGVNARSRAFGRILVLARLSCPATSRPCPPFPPRCSMLRRWSTVRVRQRTSKNPCKWAFLLSVQTPRRSFAGTRRVPFRTSGHSRTSAVSSDHRRGLPIQLSATESACKQTVYVAALQADGVRCQHGGQRSTAQRE
jgi:hypothetical protein